MNPINECYSSSCCADPADDKQSAAAMAKQLRVLADDEEEVPGVTFSHESEWIQWQATDGQNFRKAEATTQDDAQDSGKAAEVAATAAENTDQRPEETGTDSPPSTKVSHAKPLASLPKQKHATPLAPLPKSLDDPSRGFTAAEKRTQLLWELQRAQHEGSQRMSLIRCPTMLIGSLLIISTAVVFMIFYLEQSKMQFGAFLVLGVGLGNMLLLLAVFPTDRQIVTSAWLMQLMLTLPMGCYLAYIAGSNEVLSGLCVFNGRQVPCWVAEAIACADGIAALAALCCSVYLIYCRVRLRLESHFVLLPKIYKATGFLWLTIGALNVLLKQIALLEGVGSWGTTMHALGIAAGAVLFLTGLMFQHPSSRRKVHQWLGSWAGTVGGGIAELLGGRGIEEVVAVATSNLRAISCEKVQFSHFANRQTKEQSQELFLLTESAEFGGVDAFVSHGWHDDAQAKWDTFQAWRKEFKELHGREPKIWLDMYCGTQLDIEASLAVLPVYIASCKRLLSLAGPGYLRDLRSLVEIFTFAEVGRSAEDFELRVLPSEKNMDDLVASLKVWQATSSHEAEIPYLRMVLEAGYAGQHGIESIVKTVLRVGMDRHQNV
eukprot:TRINITY_DN102599_c0_g1_i1.p1 TRINITY_DN102599_c0_g1~~TRINITY_DN102599_c0_g1_i1.p1  ORF type:complete len:604 (-),score=114.49 TRINITY_DN102599_c0_g1_i1:21-1832(-)